MKTLDYFTKRNSTISIIAEAAKKLPSEKEKEAAEIRLNKTAFTSKDIVYFHKILLQADAA